MNSLSFRFSWYYLDRTTHLESAQKTDHCQFCPCPIFGNGDVTFVTLSICYFAPKIATE
jgi:hypothetical protein